MSRISFCRACYNIKHGIKTRLRVPHTCGYEDFSNLKTEKQVDDSVRSLSSITKEEALEVCRLLTPSVFFNSDPMRGEWIKVDYKELGIEGGGFRIRNKKNDFEYDFDFEVDGITVLNKHECGENDYPVAVVAAYNAISYLCDKGIQLNYMA